MADERSIKLLLCAFSINLHIKAILSKFVFVEQTEMAMQLVTTKKKAKGDRLNWTPLKDVKPVRLNADTIRGKVVDVQVEARRKNQEKPKLLIP